MTATEIIYAIREKLKAYTDDTRYSDSYLMFLINLKRSFYIRREYNQLQRTFDSDVLQSVCMELEEVDSSVCPECKDLTITDCLVIRTKKKVPKSIELHSRNSIVRVAPVGVLDKRFSLVSFIKMPYAGETKYESKFIFATIHPNGHIYLKAQDPAYKSLEFINIVGLFENPDDIAEYSCGTTPCYDYNVNDYPVAGWMTDIIITDIVNDLARLKSLPEDLTNDAKENVAE